MQRAAHGMPRATTPLPCAAHRPPSSTRFCSAPYRARAATALLLRLPDATRLPPPCCLPPVPVVTAFIRRVHAFPADTTPHLVGVRIPHRATHRLVVVWFVLDSRTGWILPTCMVVLRCGGNDACHWRINYCYSDYLPLPALLNTSYVVPTYGDLLFAAAYR